MFQELIQNKYFTIAILLALLGLILMYIQKDSYSVENMQNVDLTPLAHNLTETPWADNNDNEQYKSVGNAFDQQADNEVISKLSNRGDYATFLQRLDARFSAYDTCGSC